MIINKLIVKIDDLIFDYGDKKLIEIDRLTIYENETIAIIGNNGVGKTTLLKLLTGELSPIKGSIKCYADFSYASQIIDLDSYDKRHDFNVVSARLLENCKGEMSGGEKSIINIAQSLVDDKTFLILDEPTTHLDVEEVGKMINLFKYRDITLVFVSHNREFINALADKIWLIEDFTVKEYVGNYNDFMNIRTNENICYERKRKEYLSEKKRLETIVEEKAIKARKIMKVTDKNKKKNIKPNRLASTKQKDTVQKRMNKSMKSAEKRIEILDVVEKKETRIEVVYPDIQFVKSHSEYPIIVSDLELWGGERHLITKGNFQIQQGSKVAFTGRNGVGKSTLFNHIYNNGQGVLNSKSSRIVYYSQLDYIKNDNKTIYTYVKELDNMPDNYIYSVLINLGFSYNDLNKKTSTLSGGEAVRLTLASVFLRKSNILIMDEPTTFLDIETRNSLASMLIQYKGTILFTSHDIQFIDDVADIIYEIKDKTIKLIYEKES